jgi:hypothetical protein
MVLVPPAGRNKPDMQNQNDDCESSLHCEMHTGDCLSPPTANSAGNLNCNCWISIRANRIAITPLSARIADVPFTVMDVWYTRGTINRSSPSNPKMIAASMPV